MHYESDACGAGQSDSPKPSHEGPWVFPDDKRGEMHCSVEVKTQPQALYHRGLYPGSTTGWCLTSCLTTRCLDSLICKKGLVRVSTS